MHAQLPLRDPEGELLCFADLMLFPGIRCVDSGLPVIMGADFS